MKELCSREDFTQQKRATPVLAANMELSWIMMHFARNLDSLWDNTDSLQI